MAPNADDVSNAVMGPVVCEIWIDGEYLTVHNEITEQFEYARAAFEGSWVTYEQGLVKRCVFRVATHGYPEAMGEFLKDFIMGRVSLDLVDDESLPWVFEILGIYEWAPLQTEVERCLLRVRDKCARFILEYCYVDRSRVLQEYIERDIRGKAWQWDGEDMSRLLRLVPAGVLAECILMYREKLHLPTHARVDVFAEEVRRAGYFSQTETSGIPRTLTRPILDDTTVKLSNATFTFCKPGDFWRRFDRYTLGIFSPDGKEFISYPAARIPEIRVPLGVGRSLRRDRDRLTNSMLSLSREVRVTGGVICKLIRGELPDYETDIDLFVQDNFMHEAISVFRSRFPDCTVMIQNGSIANIRVPDPAAPEDPSRVRKFQLVPSRDPMVDIFKFDLTNNMLWIVPGRRTLYASPVAYADLLSNQATMMTPFTKPYRFNKAAAIVGNLRVYSSFCLEGSPVVFGPGNLSGLQEVLDSAIPNKTQPEEPYVPEMNLRKKASYIARFPKVFRYDDSRYNVENLSTFYSGIKGVSFGPEYLEIEGPSGNRILTIGGQARAVMARVLSNLARMELEPLQLTSIFIGGINIDHVTFHVDFPHRHSVQITVEKNYQTLYTKEYQLVEASLQ
jgi:hypothetical protein